MADPVLRSMVLQKDQELLSAGDTRDYWVRYQELGNDVRTWRDNLVKANTPAAPSPLDDKRNRKASAPGVPKAANVKAPTPVTDDDREESVSDVISAIAKARGGPQWARS